MRWGKKQPKKGLTYDQMAIFFLKQTSEIVTSTSQTLEEQLDANQQSKLTKAQEELFYFFVFAIDYWWQMSPSYTQEQKRIFEKIFSTHLQILCGDDAQGQAMWNTLQERFIAYGQIVNEQKGDSAKLMGFGMKLSECCGMASPFLLLVAPDLFTKAMELVSVFRARQ